MKFKTKWPLRLDIQFFADETPPADPPAGGKPGEGDPEEKLTTFTQSEVDSRISKAVDSALEKARKKFEDEKKQAIEDAKKDAEDYAKMSAKEREEAEIQKRLKAIEDRERELNEKQLLTEIESDLKEQALPLSFAQPLLRLGENEEIKKAIAGIKKDFDTAVNERVKEELRQDTPGVGSGRKQAHSASSMAEKARKHRLIK